MDVRQLRYFINVAETSSFSEASRRCNLSQSAISQQIHALEKELNTTLFIRNSHNVKLTESGSELLPLARKVMMSFDECYDHMSNLDGKLGGTLNIGMSHYVEPYIRQAALLMMKSYPDVRLNMCYYPTHILNQMLRDHELDLAFTANQAKPGEDIESMPILSFHLRVVMRRSHPLAEKEVIDMEDLRKYGFVANEVGPRIYETLQDYLNVDFDKLDVRAVVTSPHGALNLVRDSNYIALLPARIVIGQPSVVAKPLTGDDKPIQCYAHWMVDVCKKKSTDMFLRFLEEYSVPYVNSIDE